MLYLLVRLGGDDYAIETGGIRRVVPFARLKSLPAGLAEIAGLLNYHGTAVPVLDLAFMVAGGATRDQLGARIVLADVSVPHAGPRLLGLLVTEARSVARFAPDDFQPAGIRPDGAPWLGPVAEHDHRLVQRLDPGLLLPPPLITALLASAETALAA